MASSESLQNSIGYLEKELEIQLTSPEPRCQESTQMGLLSLPFLRSSLLALVTSLQFRPRSAALFLQPGVNSDIGLSFSSFLRDSGYKRFISLAPASSNFRFESTQMIKELEAMKKELSTTLGEIALIFCPIVDCPSHTNSKIQSDSVMAEPDAKINDNKLNPKPNNDKNNAKEKAQRPKRPNNDKNDKDNSKNNNKRTGQEDFKIPSKIARKIVEITIEKVICTSQNKFAVLGDEEVMEVSPSAPIPKVKPLMIKIQPASAEDHENIKNLLIIKKADHYVIEHPTVIKAVIKGLPTSTNVADVESELKSKGMAVEKITQLRRFVTKSALPLFMIQIKHSEGAEKIYDLKNLNYLTVEVVPFRRRPGASRCFNCNYFNHMSKNCRMTPRCLKCGESHRTQNCPATDRLKTLHCINCNADGHLVTSRQCPKFPKLKPKNGETLPIFDFELSLRSTPSVLFEDLNLKLLFYKLTIGTFDSLL
ncbi:putative RNA-directed DNA polymerase from transposon X-element [Trichonephila clavipes]|nr:putative RNA-directed DNA polymerase from transposon X-element [Trichonephila clavipes]